MAFNYSKKIIILSLTIALMMACALYLNMSVEQSSQDIKIHEFSETWKSFVKLFLFFL